MVEASGERNGDEALTRCSERSGEEQKKDKSAQEMPEAILARECKGEVCAGSLPGTRERTREDASGVIDIAIGG